MFWLTDYLRRKYVRECFLDSKYRMRINGTHIKEIISKLGLNHLFSKNDPLFEDIIYYSIQPSRDVTLYVCWNCGHANALASLELSNGLCGGCSNFLFTPRMQKNDIDQ